MAIGLVIFNFTMIDFNKPFEGNSSIALIGVVASFCAIFILLIFRLSKKIDDKLNNQ
jgi:hypothetical protein